MHRAFFSRNFSDFGSVNNDLLAQTSNSNELKKTGFHDILLESIYCGNIL